MLKYPYDRLNNTKTVCGKTAEKEKIMNTFKKNGVLLLAHGKMMDSDKCMTLINVFDADTDTRKMTDYMKGEFAKQGAVITEFGFSETMPYDIAVALAAKKSQEIMQCISENK